MENIYLITGAPGAGKSSIANELACMGYSAFDIDDFAHWEHKATKEAAPVDSVCTEEFLETHQWICKWSDIEDYLINHPVKPPIIFLGITSNLEDLLSHFKKIFLLKCDETTILNRLRTRTTSNFGKTEIEQQNVLSWFKEFEDKMVALGAIAIANDEGMNPTLHKILHHINEDYPRPPEAKGFHPI